MITIYLIEFLIFLFIGWVIDSAYRSVASSKLRNSGYFKGPFCPIYGFGGTLTFYILFIGLFW